MRKIKIPKTISHKSWGKKRHIIDQETEITIDSIRNDASQMTKNDILIILKKKNPPLIKNPKAAITFFRN